MTFCVTPQQTHSMITHCPEWRGHPSKPSTGQNGQHILVPPGRLHLQGVKISKLDPNIELQSCPSLRCWDCGFQASGEDASYFLSQINNLSIIRLRVLELKGTSEMVLSRDWNCRLCPIRPVYKQGPWVSESLWLSKLVTEWTLEPSRLIFPWWETCFFLLQPHTSCSLLWAAACPCLIGNWEGWKEDSQNFLIVSKTLEPLAKCKWRARALKLDLAQNLVLLCTDVTSGNQLGWKWKWERIVYSSQGYYWEL